jgi:hypothetical protein
MRFNLYVLTSIVVLLSGCSNVDVSATDTNIALKGQWITEADEQVMLNPQTSGLKHWRGKLLSISDGSADISQRRQLHVIDPTSASLAPEVMQMILSDSVKNSCFAEYLSFKPDFEAIAVDPNDDNIVYIVTEDSRSVEGLSAKCAERFKNSGSTPFPSLLVRLLIKDKNTVEMTHVRPLQFDLKFAIGNYPNDGIEGLAFAKNHQLYLALEKDSETKPRIFSLDITKDFWDATDFAKLTDPQLLLPEFEAGNHPINGMDYLAVDGHDGFLIAAARNDNQLWIIDLTKHKPTTVVDLTFLAPNYDDSCDKWDAMDNASLEGVAVIGDTVWLVNDPWKARYMRNVVCESSRDKYHRMAPLLFSLPVDNEWVK